MPVRPSLAAGAAALTLLVAACTSGHSDRAAAPTTGGTNTEAGPSSTAPALNPCTLFSKTQVQAAVGRKVSSAREAPLGPTCIFTGGNGAVAATVSVQALSFDQTRVRMKDTQTTTVANRQVVCGVYGNTEAIVSVGGERVLVVQAPCAAAFKLVALALPKLTH